MITGCISDCTAVSKLPCRQSFYGERKGESKLPTFHLFKLRLTDNLTSWVKLLVGCSVKGYDTIIGLWIVLFFFFFMVMYNKSGISKCLISRGVMHLDDQISMGCRFWECITALDA